MTDITIPLEALRAARNAYFKATHLSWQGAVDAACHAMLVAWPGMHTGWQCIGCGDDAQIILPLPTENTSAEG